MAIAAFVVALVALALAILALLLIMAAFQVRSNFMDVADEINKITKVG